MKAKSLYIQKLAYDENTGNEIIGLFPSEANPAIVSSYTYDAKRMGGAPTLTATIYSSEPLQWKKEEFVEYNGDRFFASYTPNSTKDNSSRMWKSEITFTSRRELLDNTLFFDVVVDDVDTQNKDRYRSNQTKFTFGGTIYEFVARINSSMAYCGLYRPTDEHKGYYVVIDEGYGTDEVKEVSFEDQYLTDVLQLINTTFELDYYWDGNVCHVGKVQHDLTDTPIKYGSSDALISVSKKNANYKIVDMITGYGSSDNLPYYYPNDDEFGEAVFNTENFSKSLVSSISLGDVWKWNSDVYNNTLIFSKNSKDSYIANVFGTSSYLITNFGGKDYKGKGEESKNVIPTCSMGEEYTEHNSSAVSRLIGSTTIWTLFEFTSSAKEDTVKMDGLSFVAKEADSALKFGLEFSYEYAYYVGENTNIDTAYKSIQSVRGGGSMSEEGGSSFGNSDSDVSNGWAFGDNIDGLSNYTKSSKKEHTFERNSTSTIVIACKITATNIKKASGTRRMNTVSTSISGSIELTRKPSSVYYFETSDGHTQPYDESGIKINGIGDIPHKDLTFSFDGTYWNATEGGENNAAKITITDRVWLAPSSVLMPSIYRNTKGAERFYYALNNTHKLPSGSGYYEFVNLYKKGNPHQGTVTFDDIKPTINGIVNAEGQLFGEIADVAFDKEDSDVKDSDGNYIHSYFYIKLHKFNGDFGFDLFAHALASESAKINLIKSNGCPACSFVIYKQPSADNSKYYNCVSVDENGNLKQVNTDKNDYIFANASDAYEDKLNQDSTQKELWIAVQKDTSTLGIVMPNASAGFKPQKGDLFVITGIKPPKVLVTAAEKRLDDALVKHMSENNTDQFNYSVKFSRIFLQENPDFASKLNENAKLSIQIQGDSDSDGNLISHEVFVSNYSVKVDNDELAEVEIELVNSLEVTKSDTKQIIDAVKGEAVKSLSSMVGGSNTNSFNASITDKMYLSKLNDDTAKGTITWEKVQKFLKGLNIGEGNGTWSSDGTLSLFRLLTNNFSSGPYGQGAQIDEKGDMEVNSIYARQFISAPKFVFNEISVTKAEQWNTNGYGTIESVDVKNRIITLHLEENDYGSLQVGDICRGLYADIDNAHGADKIEEGALDDCNFVQHKGFFSTYFYVMHIITNEKGKFVFQYGKKSSVTPDPCAYMDFAQYGSFTDEKRQSSMYFSSRGNSYIEVLDGVCTWEVQPQNRVARYGWLGGLALVKKDGSIVRPEGNGIYVQDNIYFGGNINYLQGLSGLDDLREEAKAYDVSLSQYQSVITVDDMGNVINGLYTEDEAKTTKQYRISTAVFVRKGMDILFEEDGNTEDVTAGHYRVHAVSEDCEVMVQNSTIFVTAIRNIKDGVAGTKDDATFDYDAMRKATDAMVTIVVELEGKTSKMVQMPIRIQHDTLPFMVCDLSNESASVAWNTKTAKYIGLPIKTKVSLLYHNEPWAISSLNISKVAGLKTSMSIEGKEKVITIDADNLTADTLAQVTKMNITVVGRYAGANYEYTRELTILKSSDTVVYELIPSADSIVVDKDGNKTVNSVSCDVYATSSDDKRYKLTALPAGMSLKYGKSENATTSVGIGSDVPVSVSDKMVTFALYDSNNNMLDKESVPVVAFGKDGKGIEYIFKLQNSAPSNPTPSDYATNAEYQRTDKEFVPSGWTDDPTGVDAVNQYEWVCKRVSTNGHWGAFSEPAEYAHFGKHAPKAKSSDDIVTIPTDSNGNALLAFREEVGFSLLVDGHECNISSIQKYSSTLSNVSCSISSNVVTIKCEEGANLGMVAQTIVFKVTGTLDGSTYIDYVTVKIVPNVTGADGDGYEYIYYQSNYLNNDFSAPKRTNGKLTDGWQDDLMAPTEDKRYVFVAYKRGELGSDGEFSMPELFNRYPRSIISQETKFIAWHSLTDAPDANKIWYYGSTDMPKDFSDDKPWLWKVVRTNYTEGDPEYTVSCEGYKAKDGDGLIVGYQSSASEPSVLPTPKTLADYDKAQDDIGSGWTKTAPATGGKSIVLGGKITTDEISDRYNSSTNAWGTEVSEILLDGIKQKKTFYKTPSSLGNNGKCIRRIKVVNHFRDSYLRVMMKSYSETNWDLVCISRLYLPSEVIDDKGNQLKTDDEYLSKSKYAYEVSGNGQSLVAELSMPDAGEYYFFIGYFKDGSNDSYGDYGLFAWQAMIALTESLWRTDGTVDTVGNITWSKAMPMQAEAIVMERAYIATTNDTKAPAKPYRTNGILQGGWTAKRLAVSSTNRFIWESVRTGKHGTDSVQDDWSLPVVVANFAEAGKMGKNGCIVRNSEGWKSGATYHNDSALTKEQKYIDLIYIEDNNANDGWSIYQCNVTHTATGSSFDPSAVDSDKNKLWTKLSDTGPMYSPLIVAKNAVLKFAQGQQFNLMEGNNIFGSFRWVKDDVDYAFWIGGTEGSNATTSITRGGKFKTTDADITGKITATSGQIGGFKLEDNNLVCSNARLAIGEERNSFTRMVVLDAKSFTYDSYNFALSVVNYGIVTQSSTTQAGIHINVGASNSSVQYPGIVMENGTFVGFRIPIVPLYYSMDLRNSASIYASGMCIRCNNSSSITITLPTSATGAKTGDVFTVIRAGTGDVTIKAPAGVSYRTSSGKTGEFTSTKKNEQIHLIFDGDTWFSECSAG
nr:MAG TPA: hypothetical protein [Caudoviricetes sp.]